ncbi:hypothetical protein [Nocardia brasiliensis]|uniref:hypothetical protein n=1 Tax=Nocardia brasiliensis TaxID=37326 RepID=UPI002456F5FD|nr:hypothetical protein [Nocardia brasiliensis]
MVFNTEPDLVEWDEWSYLPAVAVGPLRFGMTADEVTEVAEILGQAEVSDCPRDHVIFSPTRKV